MKIGILTFHQALNYGAVLQTYALQHFIQENFQNVYVEVIDYRSAHFSMKNGYKITFSGNPLRIPLKLINRYRKKLKFDYFIKQNIILSKSVFCEENINSANSLYDLFIVGSDQVWNPILTNGDMNYLLKFADIKKRISYAASLGLKNLPEEYKPSFSHLLNDFKSISVRERVSIPILQELGIHKHINVNLDPTMLLKETEWNRIAETINARKKYILIYVIHYSKDLNEYAKRFAKLNGYETVYVGPFVFDSEIRYVSSPKVGELLGLFKSAEYVFVSSFHGTVFSILFHKQFLANVSYKDGRNERVDSLLELCNLEHRTLQNVDCISEKIAWNEIDNTIQKKRENAYQYFKGIFN